MKRVISLIIMVLYLIPAIGITVSAHYCGGKLADVSVFGAKPKMNCACGVNNQNGKVVLKNKCCERFIYSLKLEKQQLKETRLDFKTIDLVAPQKTVPLVVNQIALIVPTKTALSYSPNLPPGRYKAPIYIQNDSFLI